ncbi:MAG: hypothetical protein ACRYG7_13050 [Janthinobacterium lividum]
MKTAEEYLRAAIGYELRSSRMTYVDALEAVQAAIDDADSVREQVRQALTDYFDNVLPDPLPLPEAAPPIRLGACRKCGEWRRDCGNAECPTAAPFQRVFPPACPRCLQRGAECLCPPKPLGEEPPF